MLVVQLFLFLHRKYIHFSDKIKFHLLLGACTVTNLSEDNKFHSLIIIILAKPLLLIEK